MLILRDGLRLLNITLSKETQEKIIKYIVLLHKWNQVHNLTAIRDLKSILIRHVFDSLTVVPFVVGPNILDFGTGAGLPGIPLSLALPQCCFTLLDSSNKKTAFLNHVKLSLDLKNVSVVTKRVEDFYFSSGFATIVTRATSSIENIVKNVMHLSSKNTQILVMKGRYPGNELETIHYPVEAHSVCVPFLSEDRHIIKISNNEYSKNHSNC